MILIEQSLYYAFLACAVYLAALNNKRLESLARILASGSACSLYAWQLIT